MRTVILAALLLCGARAASAAPSMFVDETIWLAQPTPGEFAQAVTLEAAEKGGRALIVCKADAQGFTSACRPVAEAPAGRSLANSLLSLAPKYRLKPERVHEAAPKGWVIIRKSWFTADTPPDWRRRPTTQDLMTVWPTQALAAGTEGEAVLDCLVTETGSLSNCVGIEVSPGGAGFDAAVMAMAPQFNMRPAQTNGKPVPSEIIIPINFRWPAGQGRGSDVLAAPTMFLPTAAWAEAPSHEDIAAAYPRRARDEKTAGLASLICRLTKDGRLTSCQVTRVEPRKGHFGEAAKEVAKRFRMDPTTENGARLTGEVHLRISFDPRVLGEPGAAPFGSTTVVSTPTYQSVLAAQSANHASSIAGRAVINCRIAPGGRLDECTVDSEDPRDSRLGATALALKGEFRVATWSQEGLPVVGNRIKLPVRFENAEAADASAPSIP